MNERNSNRRMQRTEIVVLLALIFSSGQAAAVCGDSSLQQPPIGNEDGTLRICQSALNKYAAAVLPLSRSADFTFDIPNPVTIWPFITFTGTATAEVDSVTFVITTGAVIVNSQVSGAILGFNYSFSMSTTASVAIDAVSESLVFFPGSMLVRPRVRVWEFPEIFVSSPFPIDLGPSFTVAAIPLGALILKVRTADGPRNFRLDASDHNLTRHAGFFELKGNVQIR